MAEGISLGALVQPGAMVHAPSYGNRSAVPGAIYSAQSLNKGLRAAVVLVSCGRRKVYDLGHCIVKIGAEEHLRRESDNIQMIRQTCPNIAHYLPEIFANHTVVDRPGLLAVTMSKLRGVPLSDCLDEIDPYGLSNIASQVAAFVTNLRHHTGAHYGPLHPCLGFDDPIFDPPVHGTVASMSEMHEYWKLRFRNVAAEKDVKALESVPIPDPAEGERPPVLTHGDLAARNILVADGQLTGIIDWECAGYHPYFWESVRMLWDQQAGERWQKLMPSIIKQHYREYLVYRWIMASVCQ